MDSLADYTKIDTVNIDGEPYDVYVSKKGKFNAAKFSTRVLVLETDCASVAALKVRIEKQKPDVASKPVELTKISGGYYHDSDKLQFTDITIVREKKERRGSSFITSDGQVLNLGYHGTTCRRLSKGEKVELEKLRKAMVESDKAYKAYKAKVSVGGHHVAEALRTGVLKTHGLEV